MSFIKKKMVKCTCGKSTFCIDFGFIGAGNQTRISGKKQCPSCKTWWDVNSFGSISSLKEEPHGELIEEKTMNLRFYDSQEFPTPRLQQEVIIKDPKYNETEKVWRNIPIFISSYD